LTVYGQKFGRELSKAFGDVAFKGMSLEDSMKRLLMRFSEFAFKRAMAPIENAFGQAFGNLSGPVSGGMGAPFASGATVGQAMPSLFATGGVVSNPTFFGFGRGNTGIAGERGPEAILPLARGADGRLGVRSGKSTGGANVTVNISTPDVDGFRKSQAQVGAILQRMVSSGNRVL